MLKTGLVIGLLLSATCADYASKLKAFFQDPETYPRDSTKNVRLQDFTFFDDAFQQLSQASPEIVKGKIFAANYMGNGRHEQLHTNQFLSKLQGHAFTETAALFKPLPADKHALMINPDWDPRSAPLEVFKFIGRIMAMSLIHGVSLRIKLPTCFFKTLMGVTCNLDDLREAYPSMFARLKPIYDGVIGEGQYFVVNHLELGSGGATRLVQPENCKDYVSKMVQYITYFKIKKPVDAIKAGFFELLPRRLFNDFTLAEVQRLFYETIPRDFSSHANVTVSETLAAATDKLSCPSEFPKGLSLQPEPVEVLHHHLRNKVDDLRNRINGDYSTKIYFTVDRNHLLESTMNVTKRWPPESFFQATRVTFEGENAVDVDGVSKEFFSLLGKTITDPKSGLFKPFSASSSFVAINPEATSPDALLKFRFFGKLLAWALLRKFQLETNVVRYLFKMLKNQPVNLADIKLADEELYSSYQKILNLTEETIAAVDYFTFTGELPDGTECPLKLRGENINISMHNKEEYVALQAAFRTTAQVKNQMDEIRAGFEFLIKLDQLAPFSAYELDVIINGVPDIDINDWQQHTQYLGYSSNDLTILNFWRVVTEMSPEDRRALLAFITGQSRTPPGGFSNMTITIVKAGGPIDNWPVAHTCFNFLDLPPYADLETMRENLLRAIQHATYFYE